MLASAIVVFREVLEAALIVGIVMAAAEGLPRRNFLVLAGIFSGLGGSVLVAGFADAITAAASGMGQEYMNAAVLFVAVVVLGWSIVWMRRHGRELSRHARDVGSGVASGGIPAYMLAVVVGLSVLREGAEAVLFLYGIAASQGASGFLMLLGGAAGVAAGVAIGYLIYRGLVKVAAHHLFGVTSWLLAFVAAGMASQGAAMLVAAGTLPPIVPRAWDTSALLSERNILGQVLHTLIGYDSHPALIQVMFYVATFGIIAVMMRLADRRPVVPRAGAVAAVILASLALPAPGKAGTKVYSPIVHEGEFAIEARGDAAVDRGDATKETQTQVYEAEYGVTDRWQTAIFGELSKDADTSLRYNGTAWENIFQLFEQGDAWVDSGVYLEYKVANQKDAADTVEGKLLLEKQLGRTINTANLIFEKGVGSHADEGTEFGYALRTKYRWRPYLEPRRMRARRRTNMRDVKPFRDQSHRLGPVILGIVPVAPSIGFYYELGWLFGLTRGSLDHSVKWLGEFEFHF